MGTRPTNRGALMQFVEEQQYVFMVRICVYIGWYKMSIAHINEGPNCKGINEHRVLMV